MLENKRVYVLDDDNYAISLLKKLLKDTGAQLCFFTDGRQLLKLAQTDPADLYILDVMMPSIDGWDVMEKIRSLPGQLMIPVLFTTSLFNEQEATAQSQHDDHCKIISKPIFKNVLIDRIRALCC